MNDRELDRWLAENVMGFIYVDKPHQQGPYYCVPGDHLPIYTAYKRTCLHLIPYWHPTTDIGQALEVVEHLRKTRSLWLSLQQYSSKSAPWRATFYFGGMAVGDRQKGYAEADTPALAICRAAKMAVEGLTTP